MSENTQNERIKALEVEVSFLKEGISETNRKLDELLELKSKGMGAFWLASLIVGTLFSLVGSSILDYFRG